MFIEGCIVSTLSGHTTLNGEPPAKWASQVDHKFLARRIEAHTPNGIIVIGSGTFDQDPDFFAERAAAGGPPRIVLTRRVPAYRQYYQKGRLEFYKITPKEFVEYYEADYQSALVLAGQKVMGAFLEADLLDRLHLNLEPRMVGKGHGIAVGNFDREFKLVSHKVHLDSPDTLMLCYDRKRKVSSENPIN